MKKLIQYSCLCGALLLSSFANSQESLWEREHGMPKGTLMVQLSPDKNDDRSNILGVELQLNQKLSESFAIGYHGMFQGQEYGDIAPTRWGLGASLNYYKKLNTMTPYVGVKRTYYGGFGNTQHALDCLYCSNVVENYSGGENFATMGINFGKWIIQLDKRISNEGSTFTESAGDPWGVGASYYNNYSNVPDPDIILSVGIAFDNLLMMFP